MEGSPKSNSPDFLALMNGTVTTVLTRIRSIGDSVPEDSKETCSHCHRPFGVFGPPRLQCGHCQGLVCPAHQSPHQLKLLETTRQFVYPDDPTSHEHTVFDYVFERCFLHYRTISRLRYQTFLEGSTMPTRFLPEPQALPAHDVPEPVTDPQFLHEGSLGNEPSRDVSAASSAGVHSLRTDSSAESSSCSTPQAAADPWATPPPDAKDAAEVSSSSPSAQGAHCLRDNRTAEAPIEVYGPDTGRHLIVLLHGVLGASSDWDNWVDLWTCEVRRRNKMEAPVESKRPRQLLVPRALSGRLEAWTALPGTARAQARSRRAKSAQCLPAQTTTNTGDVSPRWQSALHAEFCVVNLRGQTLRGIRHMATEACAQVEAFLRAHPGCFSDFSIIGHSFGGVYGKHVLTLRHEYPHFATLRPKNFIAMATPHLGCRRPMSWIHMQLVTKWFFSATGEELLMEDKERLLPNVTHASIHELRGFPNLMTYANTLLDFIVPYGTSVIQVGRGVKTPTCASSDEVVVAVHHVHSCACFVDDGSGSPSDSFYDMPEGLPPAAPAEDRVVVAGAREPRSGKAGSPGSFHGQKRAPARLSRSATVPASRRMSPPLGLHPDPRLPKETASFQAEYTRIMFEELSTLPWTRVDVNIPNLKSHELIILKSSRSRPLQNIIHHVLDHFVF